MNNDTKLSLSHDSAAILESRLTIMALEELIAKFRSGTICALNEMLDLKDMETGLHSSRLAEWAVRVG